MADLTVIGGGDPAQQGRQRGGPLAAGSGAQRLSPSQHRAERLGAALGRKIVGGHPDNLQRVLFAAGRVIAPGGDPVAAQHHADGLRVVALDRGDVQAQLEPRPPPRHPDHSVAKTVGHQLLAIGRGGQRDAGVGVQVVYMCGVDQAVHRGVDRGRGTALSVQAEVESGDHLVLARDARITADQRVQPIQPQDREARFGESAQVTAGTLHPHQVHRAAGDRVDRARLRRRVATGEVGVARVGA